MIRPLRRRHLWMIVVIAAVVVILFLAALAVRPERPLQESLPEVSGSAGLSEHGATAPHAGLPALCIGSPTDQVETVA